MHSTQKYGRFVVCNKGIGLDSDHSTMKQWDSIRNSLSATQFIIWGWDGQEVWTTTEQILWTYLHPPLTQTSDLSPSRRWPNLRTLQTRFRGRRDWRANDWSKRFRSLNNTYAAFSLCFNAMNDQITHPLTQTCVGLMMTDCSEDKVWTFEEQKFWNILPTQW